MDDEYDMFPESITNASLDAIFNFAKNNFDIPSTKVFAMKVINVGREPGSANQIL